jgi:hypothetical protein
MTTNLEPPDIAGTYKPILLGALKQTISTNTRTMLRPAIRHALIGIESLCSTTMAMTPAGVIGSFGPREDVTGQGLPMVIASPAGHVTAAITEWPDPVTLPPDIPPVEFIARIWAEVSRGIEAQDARRVVEAMLVRIASGMVGQFHSRVDDDRAAGFAPVLVAICAREERKQRLRAHGIMCMMRLPESFEVHLVDNNAQHTRH